MPRAFGVAGRHRFACSYAFAAASLTARCSCSTTEPSALADFASSVGVRTIRALLRRDHRHLQAHHPFFDCGTRWLSQRDGFNALSFEDQSQTPDQAPLSLLLLALALDHGTGPRARQLGRNRVHGYSRFSNKLNTSTRKLQGSEIPVARLSLSIQVPLSAPLGFAYLHGSSWLSRVPIVTPDWK